MRQMSATTITRARGDSAPDETRNLQARISAESYRRLLLARARRPGATLGGILTEILLDQLSDNGLMRTRGAATK
jgi:hypothetical protein